MTFASNVSILMSQFRFARHNQIPESGERLWYFYSSKRILRSNYRSRNTEFPSRGSTKVQCVSWRPGWPPSTTLLAWRFVIRCRLAFGLCRISNLCFVRAIGESGRWPLWNESFNSAPHGFSIGHRARDHVNLAWAAMDRAEQDHKRAGLRRAPD